jgi:5'-phosphate synthase pdxT subunit
MGSASVEVRVGVMAIQGAFTEHIFGLEGAFEQLRSSDHKLTDGRTLRVQEVRRSSDLNDLHGLVIPGGESTTMAKFMQRDEDFTEALQHFIKPRKYYSIEL